MFGSSRTRTRTTQTPSGTRRRGFFSSSRTTRTRTTPTGRRRGFFHRADPDRRAGGLKSSLHNPNTTHDGRKQVKYELRAMGRGNEAHGHPSMKSRIKHFFGIRSKQSRHRTTRATHY